MPSASPLRHETRSYSHVSLPPHSLVNLSLIIPALVIHHSFNLSLQAQNLPFQQILPTLDFFYILDCLTIMGLDRTGPIMLIILFLVSHFNFLFIPCGRLSWLPISLLLHIKYTLSYRIVTITISLTLLTLTLKICNMWAYIHVSLLITTVCVCITAVISGVSIVCVL